MRGSELEVVVTVPEMETQSWEELFWNVIFEVLLVERSENLLEWMLESKRKSGPVRWMKGGGLAEVFGSGIEGRVQVRG